MEHRKYISFSLHGERAWVGMEWTSVCVVHVCCVVCIIYKRCVCWCKKDGFTGFFSVEYCLCVCVCVCVCVCCMET